MAPNNVEYTAQQGVWSGVNVTFYAIGTLAMLVFLGFTAFLLRRKGPAADRLPRRAFAVCILTMLIYFICIIIISAVTGTGVLTQGYLLAYILRQFFYWIATCLNFHVYYELIHLLLARARPRPRTKHRAGRIYHWTWLGILVIMACLGFTMFTAKNVLSGSDEGYSAYTRIAMNRIIVAADCVEWIASWEIVPWAVIIFVKYPRCLGDNKVPTLFLLLSAIFWALSGLFRGLQIIFNLSSVFSELPMRAVTGLTICIVCNIATTVVSLALVLALLFRWTKLPGSESGTDNAGRKPESNSQRPPPAGELPAEDVRLEAASTPLFAELEGDHTQVFEAEAVDSQRVEVVGQSRFELHAG